MSPVVPSRGKSVNHVYGQKFRAAGLKHSEFPIVWILFVPLTFNDQVDPNQLSENDIGRGWSVGWTKYGNIGNALLGCI